MAVNFSAGFNITSNEVVDTRIFKTKDQMLNMTSAELARQPDPYFCMCIDDGQIYFYSKNNPTSTVTGKFKAFDSTVATDINTSTEVKGALVTNISDNLTNNTTVQTALGSAVENSETVKGSIATVVETSETVKSSIANVVKTDEGVKSSIADVVENSEAVQSSIASAVETSPAIKDSIAAAVETSPAIKESIATSVQDSLTSGDVQVPVATTVLQGTVISSANVNQVSVSSTGVMEVNKLGVEKLQNTSGTVLVLRGGSAPAPTV